MTRVLKIRINMPDGKTITWSLTSPATTLQLSTVKAIIDDAISMNMIYRDGVEADSFRDAYIYETNTIELS